MTNFLQDLRYALRQMRRAPAFALTGVLTLALAIGAACVMFSVVRSTLLEPLPYPEPNRLLGIGMGQPGETPSYTQTGEAAQFLFEHAKSFSSFGLTEGGAHEQNLSVGNGQPLSVRSLRVSSGYLPTLGVAPLLGRTFTSAEDLPGTGEVVVLSEALWRGALGGDPGVIGRVLRINGDPATVVGVMPQSLMTVDAPAFWQPLRLSPKDPGYLGTNYGLVARLRPGTSLAEAGAELATLSHALLRQSATLRTWTRPGAPPLGEFVWPLQAVVAADARPGILALFAAVAAVLLIACLNLAALMTARAAVRRSELAVRSALGATRLALLRLILGESFVIAAMGGLLGLAVAYATMPILLRYAPLELPKLHTPSVDVRTVLFGIATGLVATLLFGLLPAMATLRSERPAALGGRRIASNSAPQQRLGKILLTAQVALATALLATGAVLLGTFVHLRSQTPGIRPAHLDVLQVQLRGERYRTAAPTGQFIDAAVQRLSSLPGVSSAAAIYGLPLEGGLNNSGGPADRPELIKLVETRFITPGYFKTAGTPLLAGEDFTAAARANTQPVALINELAARRWFDNAGGALDRLVIDRLIIDGGRPPRRVLGVVAPVHTASLADAQISMVYIPIAQMDDKVTHAVNGWFPVSFVLRVRPEAGVEPGLAHAAAGVVSAIDPNLAVSKFATMQSFVEKSYAAPRFFSWLAGGFAGFSLLLTVIGLFGLLSYQVAARTREIGVRMAVGASRTQIAGLVLRRGFLLTAIGLLAGLVIAVALEGYLLNFIASILDVSLNETRAILPGRTGAMLITAAAMLLTATAASLLPAHRAANIEPTEALRSE